MTTDEDGEEAEAGKGGRGVTGREGSPAVLQEVVRCFCADRDGNEDVGGSILFLRDHIGQSYFNA